MDKAAREKRREKNAQNSIYQRISFKRLSITKKLVILFFIVSFMPIAIISSIGYHTLRGSFEEKTLNSVRVLAEAKEHHILEFLDSKKSMVKHFASDGFIQDSVHKLINGHPGPERISDTLNKHLITKLDLEPSLDEVFIMDTDGIVIASSNNQSIGKNESDDSYFKEGMKAYYIALTNDHGHTNILTAAQPLVHTVNLDTMPEHVMGVIAIRVKKDALDSVVENRHYAKELSTNRSTQGTGKIYLVTGDGRIIISDSGSDDDFLKKIDIEPVRRCKDHEEMVGVYKNPEGKEVLGASMCLKGVGWTLIAEKDTEEAFADIENLKYETNVLLILILAMALGLAYIFAMHFTRPIKKLISGAREIGRGNMDYRIETIEGDEIGELSTAFNQMAKDLKKKEKDVALKAAELQSNIDDLERFSRLTVDRELKMIELKKRISELEKEK